MKVKIIVERTVWVAKDVDITEGELNDLKNAVSPFDLGLVDLGDIEEGETENHFKVKMDGETIVDI